MQSEDPIRQFGDSGELEASLAQLTPRDRRFVYRDVQVDVTPVGSRSLLSALLFGWWCGLLERLLGRRLRPLYLTIRLPLSVGADLRLESRRQPTPATDRLESRFRWSATHDHIVRHYLSGPLLAALEGLTDGHLILMTDDSITIGPVPLVPNTPTKALAQLIEGLPRDEGAPSPMGSSQAANAGGVEPGQPPIDQPVVIRNSSSRLQIDMWRSLLAAADVPAECLGYEQSPPWGAATPMVEMKLIVSAPDEAKARRLLEDHGPLSTEQPSYCHGCGETLSSPVQSCPACGLPIENDGRSGGGS